MLSIVIQAGGESRRMGKDKGLVDFLGRPLIARIVERLLPIADELLVTTNRPEAYQFLGVPLFADLVSGRGALGGLYTALISARHPLVGVVACDMPFISPRLMATERDILEATRADVAVPRTEYGLEPFHAIYRRDNCLPPLQSALQAGKWRVDSWFSQVRLQIISLPEIQKVDPHLLSYRNVNTPEELAEAAQLAKEIDGTDGCPGL